MRLYLPPDFSEVKSYPLVINVYGGPNSQQVSHTIDRISRILTFKFADLYWQILFLIYFLLYKFQLNAFIY